MFLWLRKSLLFCGKITSDLIYKSLRLEKGSLKDLIMCNCGLSIKFLFSIFFCWFVYCVLTPGFLGGSTVETCQPCPPGHYCDQRGGTEPSGHCVEGYYCPEGQTSRRPQLHVCSLGHYCEKVSHVPLVLKLLSVIAAEFCMRFPHSRVLWYDKHITICCSQLMLSPRLDQDCLSLHLVLCLSPFLSLLCSYHSW